MTDLAPSDPTQTVPTQPILNSPAEDPKTRPKLEGGVTFNLATEFQPAGDQPTAIAGLVEGLDDGLAHQVLLGVTPRSGDETWLLSAPPGGHNWRPGAANGFLPGELH